MKLAVYNGSPRGKASNSETIINLFIDNFSDKTAYSKYYLKDISKHDEIISDAADGYFMVFPLYTDISPYGVKVFFEKMEENKELYKGKPIWFFIHSGFPEAKQSRLLERYLKYLCKIIGTEYMGTCITGNSEGIRKLKSNSKRLIKIKNNIKVLAYDISCSKYFNSKSIEYFKRMENLPKPAVFITKSFLGLLNKGFDFMIKQNGAYDKRFDKPYA